MDNLRKIGVPKATIQRKGRFFYLVVLEVPAPSSFFSNTTTAGHWDCFGIHWARWKARRVVKRYLRIEKYLNQPIETVKVEK